MKTMKYNIYLLLLLITLFFNEYHCLQKGLRIQYFTKMDVGIGNLASHMSTVATEQDGVTSSAKCAIACAETDWCSGYLVCKKNRPKAVCVFLQVNTDTKRQMTQNNSDYASCFLYMPSNFQLVNEANLSSSTTTSQSTKTVTLPTTTETSPTTTAPSTNTPVASTTTTASSSTTTITSPTTPTPVTSTTFDPPSYCSNNVLQPSQSNNCIYGLKPGCVEYYKDCQESYDLHGHKDTAIYRIKPDGYPEPFKVKCSGSGRFLFPRVTHIQQNSFSCCPFISFNQSWAAYRQGFGDLVTFRCNYWLGNEKVAALTAQGQYKLTVLVSNNSRTPKVAYYTNFVVGNESFSFKMQYGSFDTLILIKLDDGFTAANALNQNLKGAQFYTYDHDNVGKCAATLGSGWWFDTDCARVNLNTDHDPQWYVRGTLKTFENAYMYLK